MLAVSISISIIIGAMILDGIETRREIRETQEQLNDCTELIHGYTYTRA